MRVIDIMTTEVVTVRPTTTITAALRLLAGHDISGVPVTDEAPGTAGDDDATDGAHEVVVGMVTEHDLLRGVMTQADDQRPGGLAAPVRAPRFVRQVMTAHPQAVDPLADVADVAAEFAMMPWKCLPVLSHGRLVGVVSRSDMIRALARTDADLAGELELLVRAAGHPLWTVDVDDGVVTVGGLVALQDHRAARTLARSVVGVRRVQLAAEAGA